MKRRTFLQLSPAFLALPLSLGLAGCGGSTSTTPSEIESVSDTSSDWDSDTDFVEDNSLGMGLEDAKSYSNFNNCPYFIHRSDGLFYPVLITMESNLGSAVFSSYDQLTEYAECLTICLSDGDELVYISSNSIPDKASLYCIDRIGNTIPVTLRANASRYDPSDLPRFESLCRYSQTTLPYEKRRSTYLENYSPIPFSEYDPSCSSNLTSLCSTTERVSLNASSLDSIISVGERSGKLLYTAGFENMVGDVIEKEYCYCDYDQFAYREFSPENEIETDLLYNLAQKSELVLEWYEGTEYNRCALTPSYVYFNYNESNSYSCPFTPTPNGYAVVSLNSLPSTNNSYILKCYKRPNDPWHAYLFVKP